MKCPGQANREWQKAGCCSFRTGGMRDVPSEAMTVL